MKPRIEITKTLTPFQSDHLDSLWNEEYPKNLNGRFGILLRGIKEFEHHLLFSETCELIGWAVGFQREEEMWFSIIIPSAHQDKGFGRALIDSLKRRYNKLNGWVIDHDDDLKVNGEPYKSPMPFYLKNGFDIINDERIETEIISAVKICWAI